MRRLALFVTLVAAGCGGSSNPNARPLHDVEAATRALNRALGIQSAFVTSGNIDTGATTTIIANALVNRVMSEAAGCVTTAPTTDNTMHADFGASCALATAGMHVGGTVDGRVNPDPATNGVIVTLTLNVTVDGGAPLTGDILISTPDGNVFTWASDGLTLDGTTMTAPLATGGIASMGATIDVDHGTANGAPLILAAVHELFFGCYPDDGAATLDMLEVDFASDTPQSGHVMLSTGAGATLPARAGCPQRMIVAACYFAGAVLAWWMARRLHRETLRKRAWPTVEGRLLERGVGPMLASGRGAHVPHVKYVYVVAGHEYTGDQCYLVRNTGALPRQVQALVEGLPDVVRVHYDPADPRDAWLLETPMVYYWLLVGMAVVAGLLGVVQLAAAR